MGWLVGIGGRHRRAKFPCDALVGCVGRNIHNDECFLPTAQRTVRARLCALVVVNATSACYRGHLRKQTTPSITACPPSIRTVGVGDLLAYAR